MRTKTVLVFLSLLGFSNALLALPKEPGEVLSEMAVQIRQACSRYEELWKRHQEALAAIDAQMARQQTVSEQIALLVEKDQIKTAIFECQKEANAEIVKIRYLKGLQVIKILYDKVLALDHHFSSVRTLGEINKISNPNQYPEYGKFKEFVESKRDKKFSVDLTSVLGTNSVVSLVQTFTNLIGSSLSREEKEKELEKVSCILDFTLRMQNDLNTIYFETAFLQTSNNKIKEDIETLFRDYTKPIGYMPSLEICRTGDDWEAVALKMDDYLAKVKTTAGPAQYRLQVNMEFPIDRLLQFITQYNQFIDQGGKFYEKFRIILNSYENAKQCESQLPPEYQKLKADIELAIQKFNTAYKPVEINGSKMKEILYGLNEFE